MLFLLGSLGLWGKWAKTRGLMCQVGGALGNLFYSSFFFNLHLLLIAALVVRFLTKRFIGDYERNAGKK